MLPVVDVRRDDGEMCETSIGAVEATVVLAVVHMDRGGVTRIISALTARAGKGGLVKRRYARELSLGLLAALPDEEIDTSDISELRDAFFRSATLVMPAGR